jgi:hypothetical protein
MNNARLPQRPDVLATRCICGILGILLFIAPWVLGYNSNLLATATHVILGGLIAVFSFIGLGAYQTGTWTQWVALVLGVLAFFSAWVMGFAGMGGALAASIILGGLTFIVGIIGVVMQQRQLVA